MSTSAGTSAPAVVGVTPSGDALAVAPATSGGLTLLAFLTTGYTRNASSAAEGLIAEPYPLPDCLESIAPGQTVAIGGFGLSAIDVLSALTVGRGGTFRRDQGDVEYVPGGREPRIVMYSRSGVPCRARPLVTRFEVSYDPLVFTPAAIDGLRERRGGAVYDIRDQRHRARIARETGVVNARRAAHHKIIM